MATANHVSNRFMRQLDIVPLDKIRKIDGATLIGCGAIGRQLGIQLAAVGVPNLQLIDFDGVDDHNRTTQGYELQDVGSTKVDCLARTIRLSYNDVEVVPINRKFPFMGQGKLYNIYSHIFVCVDSIFERHRIWDFVKSQPFKLFVDGRMLAETMNVLVIKSNQKDLYEKTLFDPEKEQEGSCTGRMTLYSANICAGLMTHQFTRYLRNISLQNNMFFNLLGQTYDSGYKGFS